MMIPAKSSLESGYGIGNVNKRIRLYYGKQYGVSIKSEYQAGTCATIVIPARRDEATESVSLPMAENQIDHATA